MLLAINTTSRHFGLALLEEDGTVIAEHLSWGVKEGFSQLFPALEGLLKASSTRMEGLRAVAVATGPGSFTGLRVGISTAKGLCHALGAHLLGISSLEALAFQIPYASLPITALADSRKGEVFVAQFQGDGTGDLVRLCEDRSVPLSEVSSHVRAPTVVVGALPCTQAAQAADLLPGALCAPRPLWGLRPSCVGALGLKRLSRGERDAPHLLEPVYLRPPDIRSNPYPLCPFSGLSGGHPSPKSWARPAEVSMSVDNPSKTI